MRSRVSLSSAFEKLNLFQLSAIGDDVYERLRAFAFFVSQRLAEDGASKKLQLFFSDRDDSRTLEQLARSRIWPNVLVKRELSGEESDEELVSRVGILCQPIVERFYPRLRLEVLADEFLSTGCVCEIAPPKAGVGGVTAQVRIHHGMQSFSAFVDVHTKQGLVRHKVLSGGAGGTWLALMDSLQVTREHVTIRSVPRMAYFPYLATRAAFFTGNSSVARRFVIELDRDGTQRVIQKWQKTGKGGRAIPGTEMIAKNGTQKAFMADVNRATRRR